MKKPNILIIGDCCLDEQICGTVFGTAPEAPIPVLKVTDIEHKLGMAANVAIQLRKYCIPTLWTFFKKDKHFSKFSQLVKESDIEWKHFDVGFPLIIKQRTSTGNTYISRNDYETVEPINILEHLKKHKKTLKKFDAIILSDYGKNVLGHAHEIVAFLKKETHAKIFVDPDKFKSIHAYSGVYCVKANEKESKAITLEDDVHFALQSMQGHCEWPIITLSGEGCITNLDEWWIHFKLKGVKTKLVDPTGCGDSFIASLVYHYSIGWNRLKSLKQANKDAAKCVGKFGV